MSIMDQLLAKVGEELAEVSSSLHDKSSEIFLRNMFYTPTNVVPLSDDNLHPDPLKEKNHKFSIQKPSPIFGVRKFKFSNLSTTAQVIKDSPGALYGYHLINTASSPRYVKLYDQVNPPKVGTANVDVTLMIPPLMAVDTQPALMGTLFTRGICIAATQNPADTDATAPNANDVFVNIFYI